MHYLERFSSSAANLRRVLERKMRRRVPADGEMPPNAGAMIDAVIAKAIAQGWIDDAAYAAQKARSLHRRGASLRTIRQTLGLKGVETDDQADALERLQEEKGAPLDRAAALALARRRKLGPFRRPEDREAQRDRDMAVLGRAGFPYDLVRKIIMATDPDALDE